MTISRLCRKRIFFIIDSKLQTMLIKIFTQKKKKINKKINKFFLRKKKKKEK
jgi:hypothetical protein